MITGRFRSESKSATRQRRWTLTESIVAVAILILLASLSLPTTLSNRGAPPRTQCRMNLKMIGIALKNYLNDQGVYPPAYTVNQEGQRLHSWRTLILPYLDQEELYRSIDLSKPWDDPANSALREVRLSIYRCPSARTPNTLPQQTTYLAIVTPLSCIRADRSLIPAEITDGSGETIMISEVPDSQAVPWMSPLDADESAILSISTKTAHAKGVTVLMADGVVKFIDNNISADVRRAIITASGNDDVGDL